jgi:hypothetical protein
MSGWSSLFPRFVAKWMGLAALAASAPCSQHALAENPQAPATNFNDVAADEAKSRQIVTIYPMAAPDPLLRYRFWPAPESRLTENASALIGRAVLLVANVAKEIQTDFAEKSEAWGEMPIEALPTDEMRQLLASYNAPLGELRRAENLMRTDYNLQLEALSSHEMVGTLLPELQEMRQLARVLHLNARLAVAEQRWDDAAADLRAGFRLAEFAAHSTDFLINRLVGFAISGQMMNVIEEAIQQPECPNFYWALAGLPTEQLFETKQAIEFESVLMARLFDVGNPLPDEPIGADAARARIRKMTEDLTQTMELASNARKPASTQIMAGVYVVALAEPSRELLAKTDLWAGRVDELSSAEAVLRATILKLARARDRWVAWSTLPDEMWDEYTEERNAAFEAPSADRDPLTMLVQLLSPAVGAARVAGLRQHQQHHWLATIEAIRMYAAEAGELPESLESLRPVPAWTDALAAKPFNYQRTSANEATLSRAPRFPNDQETTFQIQLRGKP